jgi:P63C domain-containing protein
MAELTSSAARKLSKLGASKGGAARANTLTSQERSEIARNAVKARWEKAGKTVADAPKQDDPEPNVVVDEMPYSMFQGTLTIGNLQLECHVLNDMRRVFTQREIVRIISGGRESGNIQRYLDGNPLISNDFHAGRTFPFRIPGQPTIATGWEATGLIEICEKYLEAKEQNLLKRNQFHLAVQASIVMRASAKTGIIALIDEATGFQKFRAKRDLQIKLQAFIAEDMQDWARMFPDEFWFELARLEGIKYSPRSRPLRWGKYIMAFVYDAIDSDVGKKLREINPEPHKGKNHHQWLKDFGRDQVHDQITKVVTIMKLCRDMKEFTSKFAVVFKKSNPQLAFEWFD